MKIVLQTLTDKQSLLKMFPIWAHYGNLNLKYTGPLLMSEIVIVMTPQKKNPDTYLKKQNKKPLKPHLFPTAAL